MLGEQTDDFKNTTFAYLHDNLKEFLNDEKFDMCFENTSHSRMIDLHAVRPADGDVQVANDFIFAVFRTLFTEEFPKVVGKMAASFKIPAIELNIVVYRRRDMRMEKERTVLTILESSEFKMKGMPEFVHERSKHYGFDHFPMKEKDVEKVTAEEWEELEFGFLKQIVDEMLERAALVFVAEEIVDEFPSLEKRIDLMMKANYDNQSTEMKLQDFKLFQKRIRLFREDQEAQEK